MLEQHLPSVALTVTRRIGDREDSNYPKQLRAPPAAGYYYIIIARSPRTLRRCSALTVSDRRTGTTKRPRKGLRGRFTRSFRCFRLRRPWQHRQSPSPHASCSGGGKGGSGSRVGAWQDSSLGGRNDVRTRHPNVRTRTRNPPEQCRKQASRSRFGRSLPSWVARSFFLIMSCTA